jgi:hypothetical protein
MAGYMAHYYISEPACEACTEAGREAALTRLRAVPDAQHRNKLWTNYRMTVARYEEILAEQGGRCAICRGEYPRDVRAKRFHVDHDHACCPSSKSCGKCIRGLLCAGCNTALGNFADDRARLLRAVDYLDQWPGSRIAATPLPRAPRKAAHNGAEGTLAP